MYVRIYISTFPVHLKVVAHTHKGRFIVSRPYVRQFVSSLQGYLSTLKTKCAIQHMRELTPLCVR
jgi:hypothetical protein